MKRTGGVVQGEGPEFKPQYHQKKKKRRIKYIVRGKNWVESWNKI
jgi:hypothetical protein